MKFKYTLVAAMLAFSTAAPVAARDSVADGSSASVAVSLLAVALPAWVAHQGSEFTVQAIRTTSNGIELSLQGVSGAIETSALVARDGAEAASVGVGTSVRVVAESTGHALVASGVLLAFVPNALGRALLHQSKH